MTTSDKLEFKINGSVRVFFNGVNCEIYLRGYVSEAKKHYEFISF